MKKKRVVGLEPTPCELYNCPLFNKCKNEVLSCEGFSDFIQYGKTNKDKIGNPSRTIYMSQFDGSTDEYILYF